MQHTIRAEQSEGRTGEEQYARSRAHDSEPEPSDHIRSAEVAALSVD